MGEIATPLAAFTMALRRSQNLSECSRRRAMFRVGSKQSMITLQMVTGGGIHPTCPSGSSSRHSCATPVGGRGVRATALAILLAACNDNAVLVSPVIDLPSNDSASAFPLNTLVVAVAHSGSPANIVSQTFASGQAIDLPGVPFGDDLVIHMTGYIGPSEVAYGRSCELAVAQNLAPPAPHVFFSRGGVFADLARPVQPELRIAGIGIADASGAGLIIGGHDPADPATAVADIERFDPHTGELRLLTAIAPRLGGAAAALGLGSDARIALLGGEDPATGTGAAFVEYVIPDAPPARRYERIDDAQLGLTDITATTMSDGSVIVVGGRPVNAAPSPSVFELNVDQGAPTVTRKRAMLAHPRYGHSATRLTDDPGASVLIVGGLDSMGVPVGAAELLRPLSDSFSTTFAYTMVVPRSRHRAVRMPEGSVMVIGGVNGAGTGVATLERFSLDNGFVDAGSDLPAGTGLVDFALTPLPDGRVLLTGGRGSDGQPVASALIIQLDVSGLSVLRTVPMSVARAGHQATLLCDGNVLITGGTDAPSVAERYNPGSVGRR